MNVLITGVAGFIGHHLALKLLERGDNVVGIDNLNDYYDVTLKENRLKRIEARINEGLPASANFKFIKLDMTDRGAVEALFASEHFGAVINLAAQAGVRYSITHPHAYIDANLVGFTNILEGARHAKVEHFVFASSSSVYGANTRMPLAESDNVDHPLSLYAVTKKANELMAHSYANLFNLPCSGLRFFTAYGPWGRPDMALFKFTKAILADEPIQVFNNGNMIRDFTYIDDIVEGIVRVIDRPAVPDPSWTGDRPNPATSYAPYRLFNIGNNNPIPLMRYIQALEKCLGKKATMELLPMQEGDVPATSADVSHLHAVTGFKPKIEVEEGIAKFVAWYSAYYNHVV